MLPIFTLLKETRVQTATMLIIVGVILLTALQIYTIYEVCSSSHKESKVIFFKTLLTKTTQLNTTISESASYAIFAYDHEKNSIRIKKGETIDTTIYLNKKIDSRLLKCKGTYDARDTSLWTLDTLSSLFKSDLKQKVFIPPFTLRLRDKDGKTLETFEHEKFNMPAWTYYFDLSLGFLDHHKLTAKFTYPIAQLWREIWDEMVTILAMCGILYLTISSLFMRLRKEKLMRKFHKEATHYLVHNLRSPIIYTKQQLSAIMASTTLTDEQRQTFEKCHEKGNNMLENINILLYDSLNSYRLAVHQELFELGPLINKIIDEHKDSSLEKHIIFNVDKQITEKVYADPIQIFAALSNLIENAIKYSGPSLRININSLIKEKHLIISVEDNGFGIKKSEQKYIFDKEYRGERYLKNPKYKGTGIGLHYVKSIATAHKGKVSVTSDGKTGSTFTIDIPQKRKKA